MQHAIARQAEAERERRAKVINAEGEFQAASRLSDAAEVISQDPVTIQLRYLQTLLEVSNNESSTIVLPLRMDVLQPLMSVAQARHSNVNGRQRERVTAALTAARAALDEATGDVETTDDAPAAETNDPRTQR